MSYLKFKNIITVITNSLMTEFRKERFLIFLVFLDLKSESEAPSAQAKVDLEDENSTGTNISKKRTRTKI